MLLKTVEETPPRTIFIFANSTRNDILKTILSRSQTLYLNKKYDSVTEALQLNSLENLPPDILDLSSQNIQTSFDKAKKIIEFLDKEEISLKDFLIKMATVNYESKRYSETENYCLLYEKLYTAYKKYKAFIQPKIVIQDLFLSTAQGN